MIDRRRVMEWMSAVAVIFLVAGSTPPALTAAQATTDNEAMTGTFTVTPRSAPANDADVSAPLTEEQARLVAAGLDRSGLETPPLPPGPAPRTSASLPPETTPPDVEDEPDAPRAPNDFATFRASTVAPGGIRSSTLEPSIATRGNAVFYVANWFAARSTNGTNFTHVNPFTRFPIPQGSPGFCCDQIAIRDPSRDLTFWLLQYLTDPNGNNVQRIAFARGANGYANDTWDWYDISAQFVGLPTNNWLDYPAMAVSANYLYITTNIFSGNTYTGSVMLRASLDQINAGGQVTFRYNRKDATGSTLTPAQVVDSSTMYIAAHHNSTTLRVYTWPESQLNASPTDVPHENFLQGTYTCLGPDGTNMCGRSSSRIRGGWLVGNELGFIWDAAQGQSGGFGNTNFPKPFIQGVTMNAATKAVTGQPLIWNNSFAYQYGHVSPNARGHVALTSTFNSATTHPSTLVSIRDDIEGSFFGTRRTMRFGTNGPGANRWGDYTTIRPANGNGYTWSVATFTLQGPCASGGQHCATVEPAFYWIGRERDTPFVSANVGRAPFDVDRNGTTEPAIRRPSGGQSLWYAPSAGFTVPFPDQPSDIPVPADYDGDGKTDIAFFRPSTGLWFGQRSANGQLQPWMILGQNGDVPVPCDYNGDGRADPAVFRPGNGLWFGLNASGSQAVLNSSATFGSFGQPGDVAVPADYDGDGTCDPAIFRPTQGLWFGLRANGSAVVLNSTTTTGPFGQFGDIAVPADYDGDGRADIAYFRPTNGQWFGLRATAGGGVALGPVFFGANGHFPVVGYYDGDVRADIATYNPSNGLLTALPTGGGPNITRNFGVVAGDAPVAKRPTPPGYPY